MMKKIKTFFNYLSKPIPLEKNFEDYDFYWRSRGFWKMLYCKDKKDVIPFNERVDVVRTCKYVDLAIPQRDHDKYGAWKKLKYDVLFVGDDWYSTKKWEAYETKLKKEKVKVIYSPYTKGTSSTIINETLKNLRQS